MANDRMIEIPEWLLDRAIQCIARAEVERAFEGCAVPSIGRRTLASLEDIQRKAKES